MVIYWNHTLASLHYSKYHQQRLEMGGPSLRPWSTEEHKKWEVITHFLTLVWRQTQCGQKFWKLTAPLPQSPRCSPDVSKVASVGLGMQCPGWNKPHKPCLSSLTGLQPHTCPAQLPWAQTGVPAPTDCQLLYMWPQFHFPEGPEKQKATNWTQGPGIRIFVLFMISSWLGLTRWTSMIQITHQ